MTIIAFCALTVALSYQNTKKDPQRIKPFINQYDWKGINFPSQKTTRKSLNQITSQLLLIFYLCHTILKKQYVHTHQKNIILNAKSGNFVNDY